MRERREGREGESKVGEASMAAAECREVMMIRVSQAIERTGPFLKQGWILEAMGSQMTGTHYRNNKTRFV
jgi:hypothetical protein